MTPKLHRALLFALIYAPFLGTAGPGLRIGTVTLCIFRLVLAICVVILLGQRTRLPRSPLCRRFFALFGVWLGYAIASLLWCVDTNEALRDIFWIAIAGSTIWSIWALRSKVPEFWNTTSAALVAGFGTIVALSTIEIATGHHFAGNFLEFLRTIDYRHPHQHRPIATFGNINDVALHVTLVIPICMYRAKQTRTVAYWGFAFIAFFMAWQCICVLAPWTISLSSILFLSLRYRSEIVAKIKIPHVRQILSIVAASTLALVLFEPMHRVEAPPMESMPPGGVLDSTPNTDFVGEPVIVNGDFFQLRTAARGESQAVRTNLIRNGLQFVQETNGWGLGAGGFRSAMDRGRQHRSVGTIRNPHCFLFELLSQYGVLVTGLLIGWFFQVLVRLAKSASHNDLAALGIVWMFSYAIMSNSPSSFLGAPIGWVIVALFTVCAVDSELRSTSQTAS